MRAIELERAVDSIKVLELGLDLAQPDSVGGSSGRAVERAFNEHYEAFTDLSTRIQAVTALNRELAAAAQHATQAVILSIHGDAAPSLNLYQPGGSTESAPQPPVFVDEGL